MIPYGRQNINEEDIRAVVEVLRSDWLTQGPAVAKFETLVREYCGADNAVAVCSATAALHIACLALGLGRGDLLWTTPNTFVASANCALYCGAMVDFVDIDRRTYNMSVEALRSKLEHAAREGRLPKIVVPVHFAGQSCEMREIKALAKTYGFRIIEDASHAIGGRYSDSVVGDCRYSDVTVFSFHPVKIVTTGEGGMALTNDPEIAARMRLLRTHGVTRDSSRMTREPEGDWDYQQIELGYNYRMTDIQAALGASQMERLSKFVERRQSLAGSYDRELTDLPVTLPWRQPDTHSAFHLYVIRLQSGGSGKTRRQAFDELRRRGIGVNVHYIPVHTQPYYTRMGFVAGQFPEAERFYAEAITLPIYPAMSAEQQNQVVQALREVLM